MPKNRCNSRLYTAMILSLLFTSGCAKNDPKQQLEKAEKDVEVFLDAWSRGEPPNRFGEADGSIQGTDPDWKAGYRLLSFLCADAKQSQEAPGIVRCRVSLFLRDQQGGQLEKEVVYDVRLGEKSVITRVSP